MTEKASYFNEREHQICCVARMVEDARTYWVAGGGSPMASILLAKKLYAPNAVYVTEDGVINPEPMLPLDPLMTMVTSRSPYRALQRGRMNTVRLHRQHVLEDDPHDRPAGPEVPAPRDLHPLARLPRRQRGRPRARRPPPRHRPLARRHPLGRVRLPGPPPDRKSTR